MTEGRRGRGDPAEQIEHHKLVISPGSSETLQPPQSGVITITIRPGRIQTDEQEKPEGILPRRREKGTAQLPAVMTAGTEGSFSC